MVKAKRECVNQKALAMFYGFEYEKAYKFKKLFDANEIYLLYSSTTVPTVPLDHP